MVSFYLCVLLNQNVRLLMSVWTKKNQNVLQKICGYKFRFFVGMHPNVGWYYEDMNLYMILYLEQMLIFHLNKDIDE